MIDFSKQKVREQLFGDEDALKDDPNRLRAYYFKGEAYQQVISDEKLCLLVGYKGTGKSALLRVACNEEIDTGKPAISINAYDFDSSSLPSSGSNDLASHVRDWKKRLSEKIIDSAFRCLEIRGKTLMDFNKGFKEEGYTDEDISYYLKLKFEQAKDNLPSDSSKRLLDSFLEDGKLSVYIDEIDTLWSGKIEDINNISALLIASRDIISQKNLGLSFKIALRPDIYRIVKTSTAHGDKIEGSVVWQSWQPHEILVLLVKRILTFEQQSVDEQELLHKSQHNLTNDYLSKIMGEKFIGKGAWAGSDGTGIPMHQFLLSVIRNRPRDMVKLCTAAAKQAGTSKAQRISTSHFDKVLAAYSSNRLEDTIAEYEGELPKIKDLLLKMAPEERRSVAKESYLYTTESLRKKIKQITIYQFKFADGSVAKDDDLIAFMYKIGFLTATSRSGEGEPLIRQYFEVNQYLSASVDFGFDWEIHPAFRWALQPRDLDSILSTIEPVRSQ
jgi:hypothetical protein